MDPGKEAFYKEIVSDELNLLKKHKKNGGDL